MVESEILIVILRYYCNSYLYCMKFVDEIKQIKIILVVIAIVIALASLMVSHYLIKDLSIEESNKMEVWSEALRAINNADANTDLTLVLRVLNGNNTIPVIVLYKNDSIQTYRNIAIQGKDTTAFLYKKLEEMKRANRNIRITLNDDTGNVVSEENQDYVNIYYDDSLMLKRLASYPYVQLGVVLIFVIVAIFALLSSKKAEQNKVWVGLSKETAHQLGTPISSLMAWVEILRTKYADDELLPEMNNDVKRLQVIADRFSKIGSMPEPQLNNLNEVVENATNYISRRTSNKVFFVKNLPDESLQIRLNTSLFEWVIENLCKNAIDAMNGQGTITVTVMDASDKVCIDVSDTGKGIPKSKYKTVFTPGYTTKKRGWGLGLSLAKRIIEEYHRGKIYVKRSEANKGTTFRIELKK